MSKQVTTEEMKAMQELSKDEQDLLFDIILHLREDNFIYDEKKKEDVYLFEKVGAEAIYNVLKRLILVNRM